LIDSDNGPNPADSPSARRVDSNEFSTAGAPGGSERPHSNGKAGSPMGTCA